MKDAKSCTGCRHHIGAGFCRLNLERECGEGGHEAWGATRGAPIWAGGFVDAAVSCGWGDKAAAADYMRENPKDVYTTDDLVALRRARLVRYDAANPKQVITDGRNTARTTKRYRVYNGHDV